MQAILLWFCLATEVACGGCGLNPETISGLRVAAVTGTQARIRWSGKHGSNCRVGVAVEPSTEYVFAPCHRPNEAQVEEALLVGLNPGTTYNFIIQSDDVTSKLTSRMGQFTTAFEAGDDKPGRLKAGPVHAFPEAQGSGATSSGGSGRAGGTPQIYEVVNLEDQGGTCNGRRCAGSFRFCLEASGPRTCVFRVSGMITPRSRLAVQNPYLTVAGQTAPAGGIILGGPEQRGVVIWISTHDVIMRYLTYDGNNPNVPTGPNTGTVGFEIASGNAYNIVLDHISARWWGNKAFPLLSNDAGNVHNVSFQWILNYEPNVEHPVSGLGTDATSGSALATTEIDFHHNMIVNVDHRTPLLQGSNRVRWINNLVYNWNQFAFLSMGGVNVDIIGNKYVDGNLSQDKVHVFLGNGNGADRKDLTDNCIGSNPCDNSGPPTWYLLNNVGRSSSTPGSTSTLPTTEVNDAGQVNMTQQGWEGGERGNPNSQGPIPKSWLRYTPLPAEMFPIKADPVTSLDSILLPFVGNSQRLDCNGNWVNNRDREDARIIDQYQRRDRGSLFTGQYASPVVRGVTECVSSQKDGLPDAWKKAHGYSLTDEGLWSRPAANGYTYLENYLNGTNPID